MELSIRIRIEDWQMAWTRLDFGLYSTFMPFRNFLRFTASLRLTLVCLACAIILVFVGTLAQVNLGIHIAQKSYFDTFLVWWTPKNVSWRIPIFPGGWLIGSVLLVNLIAAQSMRFRLSWKKSGILLIHLGILLLLVGGLLTSLFSVESQMQLDEGQSLSYSEDVRRVELVLLDITDPLEDRVTSIPDSILFEDKILQHPSLPFRLKIVKYYLNARLTMANADEAPAETLATQGIGPRVRVAPQSRVTRDDEIDNASALVEIIGSSGSLGTWLVSRSIVKPQTFSYENRIWQIALRPRRYYKSYQIHLLDFAHDKYPGTEIPRNFSSRVRLTNPKQHEDREVLIYMNHPLRYEGETYYQASFANNDRTSILQVVRNPSWFTSYFACALVALGLLIQFSMHLIRFLKERRA